MSQHYSKQAFIMTHESSATMHICELSNNVTSIGFRRSSKNFESIIQFNTVSLECAEANNFFIPLYLFFFIFNTTPNLSLFNTQLARPIVLIVTLAFVRDISPEDSGLRIDRTTLLSQVYPRSVLDLQVSNKETSTLTNVFIF